MLDTLVPILVAVLVWWVSTGILIWLVGRSEPARMTAAVGLSLIVVGATFAMVELRENNSVLGMYAGFLVGIAMWAWHEAMLLFGYISGPRRSDCPTGLNSWERFKVSTQTVIHHEVLIALHAALIIWLSMAGANQVAAATFVLLWGMRISAKLLIFFGAPNASHHFLPMHLKYLSTYFNTRRRTRAFPIFLVLTGAVACLLLYNGLIHQAGTVDAIASLLLGTLALLAVFEHVALILPIPDQRLWAWAVRKQVTVEPKQQKDTLEYGRT
jgi:putative photosynthetic complex assembly protein 2